MKLKKYKYRGFTYLFVPEKAPEGAVEVKKTVAKNKARSAKNKESEAKENDD